MLINGVPAAWDPKAHAWVAAKCPSLCDADCTARCHEAHQVRWRREHRLDDCPGRLAQ